MILAITITLLTVAQTNRGAIDELLAGAFGRIEQLNYDSIAMIKITSETAKELEQYDANQVTEALYDRLKAGPPLGRNRAVVAFIAMETKAFSPDAWLERMAEEEDIFYRTSAMGIMANTKFHDNPRIQAVLREALLDQRVGLPPLSPSHTMNHVRVCDAAYNSLMKHREPKPLDYPIRIDTSRNRANALIADLRRELGIPDPPAAPNGDKVPAAPGPVSKVTSPVRQEAPPVAVKLVPKAAGDMNPWLIAGALLIAGLIGIALYRRMNRL